MTKITINEKILDDLADVLNGRVQRISCPGKYSIYWLDNKMILETHNDNIHTDSTRST